MTPFQLDRWLLNNVFRRSRVRPVALSDCVDEFGHQFGSQGNHFFVRALASTDDRAALIDHLRDHYAGHSIYAYAQQMGLGDVFFCPWEHGRVRPLAKFAPSHKIGPTPDASLTLIADRLLAIVEKIRNEGYHPRLQREGISRGYALINSAGRKRYVVRDGQHRAAALSHLGYQTVLLCTEYDHWKPSIVYRTLSRLRGNKPQNDAPAHLSEVRVADCAHWPHVADARIDADHARHFFDWVFSAGQTAKL